MAGTGPAPKHPDQRARRNATVPMSKLPKSGRPGKAPVWPLDVDIELEVGIQITKDAVKALAAEAEDLPTARDRAAARRKLQTARQKLARLEAMKKHVAAAEKKIWTQLWKTPQATQWEKRGWFREVALYARHQAKAEAGSLDDSKEARQREDRLGLNDMAMMRLHWEIVDDTAGAKQGPSRARRSTSKYGDLKVVS